MRQVSKWIVGLVLIQVVFACKEKKKTIIPIEVTQDTIAVRFERLDQEMFSFSEDFAGFKSWHNTHIQEPSFYPVFLSEIMRIAPDTASAEQIFQFSSHPDFKDLQKSIDSLYPDTKNLQREISSALLKLKTLYPDKPVPQVAFFNSGFNVGIFPDSSFLGIGLEWYLGKSNKIVNLLPTDIFPAYKKENMAPEYLVPDAIKGWLLVNTFDRKYSKNVLEYIVYYGKVMYTLDIVLPQVSDSVKMSYSSDQLAWAEKFEEKVWMEIVKNELIFSTSEKELVKLTNDGPFTNGFPQEGSPQLGIYIGWQMVHDYMNKNPDTAYQDLMFTVTAEEILKAYKPKN